MQLSNDDIEAIHRLRRKIECDIHRRISISSVTSEIQMCKTRISRIFRFAFQHSILQYHLFISMEYAKALLEDGAQAKEVAYRLGYRRAGHFTRAFQKVYGLPPSSFKKKGHCDEEYTLSGK